MNEYSLSQKLTAEFLGTLGLVLGGCGSAVLAAAFPQVGIGLLGVSLAFGLSVVTMAYAVGHVSGGHFNPAVTLADGEHLVLTRVPTSNRRNATPPAPQACRRLRRAYASAGTGARAQPPPHPPG